MQVDDESNMFIVRYEVNRVTVIENPKSYIGEPDELSRDKVRIIVKMKMIILTLKRS